MASLSGRATKRGSNQLAVEIRYFLPFKEFLTEANTPCRIESSELKGKVCTADFFMSKARGVHLSLDI